MLDDVEAALDLINELDGVMALDKLVGSEDNHEAYKEVMLVLNSQLFFLYKLQSRKYLCLLENKKC